MKSKLLLIAKRSCKLKFDNIHCYSTIYTLLHTMHRIRLKLVPDMPHLTIERSIFVWAFLILLKWAEVKGQDALANKAIGETIESKSFNLKCDKTWRFVSHLWCWANFLYAARIRFETSIEYLFSKSVSDMFKYRCGVSRRNIARFKPRMVRQSSF